MPQSELQALLDAAVDAVMVIDHHGTITTFNQSAVRIFGYEPEEVVGRNVSILMPQPYRSAHDGYLARYAATGIAHIIGVGRDVQAQRKDGSCFPAWLSVGRIGGRDPPAFVGFVRDVTPQHEAMAMVRRERDRANAYLELFRTILLTVDAEGRVVAVNEHGCRHLDTDEQAVLGRNWLDLTVAADDRARVESVLAAAAQGPRSGPPHAGQFTAHLARNPARTIAWRCVSLADGDGLLCSGEDITAELAHQEEERRAQDRLMTVSRFATMGEMAAGIAHELNQPLAAITNYARASERFLDKEPPHAADAREALHEIAAEALRAGDIIRRLRRLVRHQSSERASCDVNELLEDLQVLTQADARVHNTRVTLRMQPALPRIMVDPAQLQQVLLNLTRNAFEALSGQPAGMREITIETRRAIDGDVEILVCDNGPGVPPGILGRLFDPFATTKAGGTGLGLSMGRTIVQAHGGRLVHRPVEPHGACFQISIPALETELS